MCVCKKSYIPFKKKTWAVLLYEIFGVEKKRAWFDASWEQQKQVFVTSGEGKKSKQNNQTTPRLQHDVQ